MHKFIKFLKIIGYVLKEYIAPALTALIKITAAIASVVLGAAAGNEKRELLSIKDDPITGEKIHTYSDGSEIRYPS